MIMLILAPLVGVLGALLLVTSAAWAAPATVWCLADLSPGGFCCCRGAVPVLVVAGGAISRPYTVFCRRR